MNFQDVLWLRPRLRDPGLFPGSPAGVPKPPRGSLLVTEKKLNLKLFGCVFTLILCRH